MRVIYKYPIEIKEIVEITMPFGSEVLTVQSQFEEGFIWAVVNPDTRTKEVKRFSVMGTGFEMSAKIEAWPKKYIGTFQTFAGNYVYHVFEML